MRQIRKHRRRLSAGLVLAILLTQFATVAFACRIDLPASTPASVALPMDGCVAWAAEAQDNDTGTRANPALCHAHCDQGAQAASTTPLSVDPPTATGFFAGTAPVSAPSLPTPLISVQARNTALADSGPAPGWPPAWLAYLVLRN
ncbi:MAG: hypothetical protein ACOY9J_02555 [Pseudomonadota bacterium]